ncbi:MAG: hypothetical protein HYY96_18100 [Candidatus Tectomicrobia bacterium]|nr:hypothetical protein [Candidatus Tectomicrobia bacterium]
MRVSLHAGRECLRAFGVGAVSLGAAFVASLCCVLPLLVVLTGLGTGAFMGTTMQYRSIFLPAGVFGVLGSYALYFRERRRCRAVACRFIGARLNLVMLLGATLALLAALALDLFPDATAALLQGAMN